MSETFANQSNKPSSAQRTEQASGNLGGSLTEQASTVAHGITDQASSLAQHATRHVKEQAAELTDGAKGLASDASEKLRSSVETQKTAGADYISGLAGAVRRAAGEFDQEIPQAANYIRGAAEAIDDFSDALRRRDLSQLVRDVQGFARSQPSAFLGATLVAGFAVVRFLKSSTAAASDHSLASFSSSASGQQRSTTVQDVSTDSLSSSSQQRGY
jgi:uncharacterized protein YjbJ (UPF0337 family)